MEAEDIFVCTHDLVYPFSRTEQSDIDMLCGHKKSSVLKYMM